MNFSRNGIAKEREALQATAPKVGSRIGVSILRVLLYVFVALMVAGLGIGIGAYQGIIADAPDITDADIMPLGYASFIYDSDGNQIQKLSSIEGNRVSIDISEIPLNMQHAIVAIEDSRFYEHNGVDPHGMIRAIIVTLSSNFNESEGASTITQQLLKNNVFTGWMSETRIQRVKRKLQEQYLAVQLEKSLRESGQDPKAVVLENYLNTVNLGSGAYGVQMAAQTYFGKNAQDLTLSECAVLAAIPQNPSQNNPKIYPEENAQRMKTVLEYMLEQGYITEEAYTEAMNDNVYERIQENENNTSTEETVYSYFVDETIEQVIYDLMTQKGYTEQQAEEAVYSGGLQIYSTENSTIQNIMEEEFSNEANFPAGTEVNLDWALTLDKADGSRQNYSREMLQQYFQSLGDTTYDLYYNSAAEAQAAVDEYKASLIAEGDEIVAERISFIPEPQACMTVIDQTTGYVVGIIGGRGEKTGSLTLNRATDAYRQPGSTFKPLSTYGPALETGAITLATSETDDSASYSDGTTVNNADDSHHGSMTVRQALISSNNVIAFKVITQITPEVGYEYLTRLGISTLVNDPNYDVSQVLALGGITNGVSNLELTAAYAAVANSGVYNKPVFYTKVTDHSGNVLLENTPLSRQVFKSSTSWLLTNVMEDVVSSGTGTGFQLSNGQTVAGKTGTTDSYVDLQFVGYTPYYTAGIWTGYDTSKELAETDRQYIRTLWTNVMNRIHENLELKTFPMPEGVQQLTVCSDSGLLAGLGCKTQTEYFDIATAPTVTCTEHIPTPTPTPSTAPTGAAAQNATAQDATTVTEEEDTASEDAETE